MRSISHRLNAWQRLAVVLTVLWLIVGTYYFWFAQVDANYALAAGTKRICESADMDGVSGSSFQKCFAIYSKDMDHYGEERWGLLGATFVVMLIVTAAFWVAIWIAYRVVRWILAGRSA